VSECDQAWECQQMRPARRHEVATAWGEAVRMCAELTGVDVLEHVPDLRLGLALRRRRLQELRELLRLEDAAVVGVKIRHIVLRLHVSHRKQQRERQQQRRESAHRCGTGARIRAPVPAGACAALCFATVGSEQP
jgi:hypothetical protein